MVAEGNYIKPVSKAIGHCDRATASLRLVQATVLHNVFPRSNFFSPYITRDLAWQKFASALRGRSANSIATCNLE